MIGMDVFGKLLLVRVDLNAALLNKKIIVSKRFKAHANTIKDLQKKGARIVLLAHQGRKGGTDFISLTQHARALSKLTGTRVTYVDDLYGKKAQRAINSLQNGQAILLKNTRTMSNETKEGQDFSKTRFVQTLSKYADAFVLDAFSVAHRAHASVVGFVGVIPCFQGPNVWREIEALEKLKKPQKPFVMILSGAKSDELVDVMHALGKNADAVILCGVMGELYWKKKGIVFGKKDAFLEAYDLKELQLSKKIIMPKDFVLEDTRVVRVENLPVEQNTMDVGPLTIADIKAQIARAKTVLMKGPLGFTEKGFVRATKQTLQALKASPATSIIGGGHLTTALEECGFLDSDFTHVSLGGGSLVKYLSDKSLPGVVRIPSKL
ncbi:phosphoglycerate kinase [archaeon CG10_big_fil_rev_8_21_14_0_10_43_11]|nr:MAG: phosphoglycerate kinase [archaeon CG10_big_fil_rev_8_21_14_0_10_43_11]